MSVPRYPGPLWADRRGQPERRLPFWAALAIGAVLTAAIVALLGSIDFAVKPVDRQVTQVTLVRPPPPPPVEVRNEEPKPEPPPPKPEVKKPPEVRKIVRERPAPVPQKEAPREEARPETAPIPMEAPAPGPSGAGPSIPSEVGAPAPSAGPASREAGTVVKGLTPIHRVEPTYPRRAQQAGLSSTFLCHLYITPEGTVRDVKILRGEHVDMFARSIRDALMQWKFKPQGVELIGEMEIRFRLE